MVLVVLVAPDGSCNNLFNCCILQPLELANLWLFLAWYNGRVFICLIELLSVSRLLTKFWLGSYFPNSFCQTYISSQPHFFTIIFWDHVRDYQNPNRIVSVQFAIPHQEQFFLLRRWFPRVKPIIAGSFRSPWWLVLPTPLLCIYIWHPDPVFILHKNLAFSVWSSVLDRKWLTSPPQKKNINNPSTPHPPNPLFQSFYCLMRVGS